MELKLESIIERGRRVSDKLSNQDIIDIIDDITNVCVTLNHKDKPEMAVIDGLAILNNILKKIHKERVQDVVYGELPQILESIKVYIESKTEKNMIKGAY